MTKSAKEALMETFAIDAGRLSSVVSPGNNQVHRRPSQTEANLILTALRDNGNLRTPGMIERCIHLYENSAGYNIKCDKGPDNVDLCKVTDCPIRLAKEREQ